ncbi:squalene/phytoene synthase family protein [Streptomyces sp. P9-2B-2]|uniref:phytoene/squalene synthase family protein n=1 Tax=Streptomyces sp. P9-2B-2 TaxID=3057114 RepID=UPI0025B46522|nr:squalene/phytoene synthase family protein [Streptomyces sp. P9-2B-2]WJY36581.1 squalene/phytoene synthase family protein [Streptomyces sp. P9-2B-2]
MATWPKTLDQAGITDPALRRDYSEQRQLVAHYARAEYTAVRLLLPAPLVPDVIAATAFMHHSDNLIDQGPAEERIAALADWESRVQAALKSGEADQPVLRTLLDTLTRQPQLRQYVEDFLAGAPLEVKTAGFATEGDFQHYIDGYSLPAFLLIACLLGDGAPTAAYVAGCRTFIEASQRLDFLNDLAEDLADGRLGIPEELLTHHGLTRDGLTGTGPTGKDGAAVDGLRPLLADQVRQIRSGFSASYGLVDLVPARNRPFVRALVSIQGLTLRAAARKGTALLDGSARPPVAAALRILAREYAAARRGRDTKPAVSGSEPTAGKTA